MLDPFYIACMDDPRAGLLRLDDVAPDRFESKDYYQRYFKLNIVMDEVQFNLPLGEEGILILSLGSQHRYSIEDMSVLSAITPWVLALMRQRTTSHELSEETDSDEAVAEVVDSSSTLARGSSNLTNRELEIVHLLLSGFSSKAIAQKLKISPETVKGHRKHIYTKLGVKSHAELFAIYLKAKNEAR